MKTKLRKILHLFVYPAGLLAVLFSRLCGFFEMSVFVGLIPFQIGDLVREIYYKYTLMSVGENVHFGFGCNFTHQDVEIGDNSKIGYGCVMGRAKLGKDVLMGPNISVLSGKNMHGTDDKRIPIRLQKGCLQKVNIGNDVWIGAGAIIMADLGDGTIIGAGSVVTKPVESYHVAAGNPAHVLRER